MHDETAALRPRRGPILVFTTVVILFFLEVLLHFAYTPDDSFIYFQYARNFARHGEIAFNTGEPSYGFTGPAWMLLSSVTGMLTGNIVHGTKILDLILALGALPAFYAAARKITPDTGPASLALCAFAANSWLIRWAGSGMESSMVTLAACLVIWTVLANRAMLTFILLGILALLRPESMVLCPLAAWFYLSRQDAQTVDRKATIMGIGVFSLLVLTWVVYAKLRTGSFVPNTSVKAGWSLSFAGITETAVDVARTFFVTDGVLVVSLVILYSFMRWSTKWAAPRGWRKEFGFLIFWLATVIGFYVLSATNVVSRYLLLVAPCLPLLALIVVERLRQAYPHRAPRIMAIATVVILIHVGANQAFYWIKVEPGIMSFQKGMDANLIRLGKWLGENTPDTSRILVADIGAIGFYSRRPLDDAAGLISPQAAPFLRAGLRPYDIIATHKYKQWSQPDYIIHAADMPDALHADTNLVAKLSTEFKDMKLDRQAPAYYTLYQVKHR